MGACCARQHEPVEPGQGGVRVLEVVERRAEPIVERDFFLGPRSWLARLRDRLGQAPERLDDVRLSDDEDGEEMGTGKDALPV